MLESTEQKLKQFFEALNRKRSNDTPYSLNDFIDQAYHEIYVKHKVYLFKEYKSPLEINLFNKVIEPSQPKDHLNGNGNIGSESNKTKPCDDVFSEYLKELVPKANKDYAFFAFKFVILFRECINKFKQHETDKSLEYTQNNNPDSVPDLCNEFITEFMENADFFGMNTEELKSEFIEIIQHFCFWLFNNGYTSSRLTLLSG
jgi:hypothetical protein